MFIVFYGVWKIDLFVLFFSLFCHSKISSLVLACEVYMPGEDKPAKPLLSHLTTHIHTSYLCRPLTGVSWSLVPQTASLSYTSSHVYHVLDSYLDPSTIFVHTSTDDQGTAGEGEVTETWWDSGWLHVLHHADAVTMHPPVLVFFTAKIATFLTTALYPKASLNRLDVHLVAGFQSITVLLLIGGVFGEWGPKLHSDQILPRGFGLIHHTPHYHYHPMRQTLAWSSRLSAVKISSISK